MIGYIYKTTNLINGKIYIGQHKSSSFDTNYYGSGKLLIKALKKYGKENFKIELIEGCSSKETLNEREIYWIKEYNTQDSTIGYNIADGGVYFSSGYHQGMLGKHQSDYQKQRVRESNSYLRTEDTKQKMSDSARKRTKNRKTINGKVFVYKDNIQTCIDRDKLNTYLNEGWKKGRFPKSEEEKRILKEKYANKVYVSKDNKTILISKDELSEYLSKGYEVKRVKYSKDVGKNISKAKKGKIAITNYTETKFINLEDFPYYEKQGYVRGNLTNIKRMKNKKKTR